MNKKIVIIILSICFIVFMLFLFLGNPNNGDWMYKINEDYEIWHINSLDISLVRKRKIHLVRLLVVILRNLNIMINIYF